ncbi:lipoprotein, putative [Geotalea daltonii FRC-32]|uniref:Lipoprotein, putative n=1 Tax=Geotalea daltonii (strain DSM 22248 / JCM 15807 / FRC-32) TaxID=316067 RepID=B9M2U1_GEODF|nr:hypothetical protein [Geotalea daltonii]ACM21287.1 lipoprotein, putative [Geotalea daltonii FRC-32]
MNKWIVAVLLVVVVAGCGVEWFPEDSTTSGSKNSNVSFSFEGTNKCSQSPGSFADSGPIQIFNLQTSATISVSGTATSKYTITNQSPRSDQGVIRPGETVSVSHQNAAQDATSKITITTLTIAGKSASFKSSIDPCPQGTTTIQ